MNNDMQVAFVESMYSGGFAPMEHEWSETYKDALEAVRKLPPHLGTSMRLKEAGKITGNSLDGSDARDLFGKYAFGRMKSWQPGDPIQDIAERLAVALSVRSEFQEDASDFALKMLLPLIASDHCADDSNELVAVIEMILDFYSKAPYPIDLFSLSETFNQSQNLPFRIRCKIGSTLLIGQKGNDRRLGIRAVVRSLFDHHTTMTLPHSDLKEGALILAHTGSATDWSHWFYELEFDQGSEGPFPNACKCFLRFCFNPEQPIFLLHYDTGTDSSNQKCWLVLAEDVLGSKNWEEFNSALRNKGAPQTDNRTDPNSFFEEKDFLEREVSARQVSEKWLESNMSEESKHKRHTRGTTGIILTFPTPGGKK